MVELTDFAPGDVAGFDLFAYKVPDGYTLKNNKVFNRFPDEIRFNGNVYTLENIIEFAPDSSGKIGVNAQYV